MPKGISSKSPTHVLWVHSAQCLPPQTTSGPLQCFFRDVAEMKPCSDLSPNQLMLRFACDTATTLVHKGDTTPLMKCLPLVLLTTL
ncbi:hypothetical protein TNCV_2233181 [Trichonephila clavipes]|nr:hypothetical protein TNCV_2233181 [Trichonephila clavipes]